MSNIHTGVTDRKKKINILILGPYGKCQNKLQELRDHLISKGYENTKLVIDFPDKSNTSADTDIYFLEKSKTSIRMWAKILLFVFDQECNNDSVLAEFFYTVEKIPEKCTATAILSSSERYLGSLLRGTIKLNHIRFREFKDVGELKRKGYSAVFQITQEINGTQWRFT